MIPFGMDNMKDKNAMSWFIPHFVMKNTEYKANTSIKYCGDCTYFASDAESRSNSLLLFRQRSNRFDAFVAHMLTIYPYEKLASATFLNFI